MSGQQIQFILAAVGRRYPDAPRRKRTSTVTRRPTDARGACKHAIGPILTV